VKYASLENLYEYGIEININALYCINIKNQRFKNKDCKKSNQTSSIYCSVVSVECDRRNCSVGFQLFEIQQDI